MPRPPFLLARTSIAPALALLSCLASPACSGSNASSNVTGGDAAPDVAIEDTTPAEVVADTPDPSGPPYPIVLVHGMGGFEQLKVVDLQYFSGVKADLAAHGESAVYTPLTDPYNTSEIRAGQLATQIDQILKSTGKSKVNLIGHSQGGMDARVLVSPNGLGYGDRVATVTTISTPHQGSQVADIAMKLLGGLPQSTVDGVTNALLGLLQETVYDISDAGNPAIRAQALELSEHNMVTSFNPKYTDDPRVAYFSYAGRSDDLDGNPDCLSALYPDDPTKLDDGQALLKPLMEYLKDGTNDKPNDGLVTVQSARWGTFLQCVPADHLSECGLIGINGVNPKSGFDHLVFFRTVVQRVRDRGY
ncbi:MAG: esterase/lipase family protein [Polyangiales bacterium]